MMGTILGSLFELFGVSVSNEADSLGHQTLNALQGQMDEVHYLSRRTKQHISEFEELISPPGEE